MSLAIKYIDIPEGIQESAVVSCSDGQPFSDVADIAAGVQDVPWATLEPGAWKLDGTRKILPDSLSNMMGWWSAEASGADCKFATPPKLTISFSEPYTSTGITFTFSPSTDQWCSEICVRWYNNNTVLAEGLFYPNAAKWTLNQTVESFDQIEIDFLSTSWPNNFAKIQKIEFGQVLVFGREQLTEVRIVNEVDPSICELTADELSFKIVENRGYQLVPQENQRIELYKNDLLQAVHYIVSSTRSEGNIYGFSCQSAIGLLTDTFLGGLYKDKPVYTLISEVLGTWSFELDPAFSGMLISGYLPVCAQRDALQQIAFAIGAIITTQGSEVIRLVPLQDNITGVFNKAQIFSGAKVETSPRIARVELIEHSYLESSEVETLIDSEEITGTDVLLTFEEPHHNYVATGGTITGFGVNWITITAAGPVTVSASKYIHSTAIRSKRNVLATAKESGNILSVESATLVHAGNSKEILERLYDASLLRQTLTQKTIIHGYRAGDRVSSISPWNTKIQGIISSMDSVLTQNGHTANVKILGIEIAAEGVYYYSGDTYSGDKEVPY